MECLNALPGIRGFGPPDELKAALQKAAKRS